LNEDSVSAGLKNVQGILLQNIIPVHKHRSLEGFTCNSDCTREKALTLYASHSRQLMLNQSEYL